MMPGNKLEVLVDKGIRRKIFLDVFEKVDLFLLSWIYEMANTIYSLEYTM